MQPVIEMDRVRTARATSAFRRLGSIPLPIRILFSADFLLGVLYVITVLARAHLYDGVVRFFDLDKELNLPSWYSSTQLFLIAVLLLVFAITQFSRRDLASWTLPLAAALFLFLSLDEDASIHEQFGTWLDTVVGSRKGTVFWKTGMWMMVCAPAFLLLIAGMGLAIRKHFKGRRGILLKFIAGLAIFVGSAAGIEILSNFVAWNGSKAGRLQVLCEEVGEMVGATIILWATYDLLRSHRIRLFHVESDSPAAPEGRSGGEDRELRRTDGKV
jgi:hypothetical protein